jgi:hypothetical protein
MYRAGLWYPKFSGSNPAEARRIFQGEKKILSTPSFRRGSKSRPVPCRRFAACKRTLKVALTRYFQVKFTGKFLAPIVPPFTARVAGVIVTCRTPGGASWKVLRFRVLQ